MPESICFKDFTSISGRVVAAWYGVRIEKIKWKPEKSHGQRSPLGYSPWGCKELDATEQLNTHTEHTHWVWWEDLTNSHLEFPSNSHSDSISGCLGGSQAKVYLLLSTLLEKEMATHSSILAWRIPGMEEPGGLPSMGSRRVGYDWSDLAAAASTLHC